MTAAATTSAVTAGIVTAATIGTFVGGVTAGVSAYIGVGLNKGFTNIQPSDLNGIIGKTLIGSVAGGVSGALIAASAGGAAVAFGLRLLGNLASWGITTVLNPPENPTSAFISLGMAVIASFTPWNWYGMTASVYEELLNYFFKKRR